MSASQMQTPGEWRANVVLKIGVPSFIALVLVYAIVKDVREANAAMHAEHVPSLVASLKIEMTCKSFICN